MDLPAKLLYYVLWSNKSNIKQFHHKFSCVTWLIHHTRWALVTTQYVCLKDMTHSWLTRLTSTRHNRGMHCPPLNVSEPGNVLYSISKRSLSDSQKNPMSDDVAPYYIPKRDLLSSQKCPMSDNAASLPIFIYIFIRFKKRALSVTTLYLRNYSCTGCNRTLLEIYYVAFWIY